MNWTAFNEANEALRTLRVTIEQQRQVIEETEAALKRIELTMMACIVDAVNPETGKALYSNAEKRDVAMMDARADNTDWQRLNDVLRAAKSHFAELRAECDLRDNWIHYAIARAAWDAEHEVAG